ncbi:MAG: hypothetical protein ACTS5G_02985, partial [Burkholderiales bacterium]
GMMQVLNNDILVNEILQQGTPHRVDIDLVVNADREQGHVWTASGFTPPSIGSGTLSEVNVVVEERPPITLMIPAFKRLFFGIEARFPAQE